jgi:hypothetical protein
MKVSYYKARKDELQKLGLIKEVRTIKSTPVIVLNTKEIVKALKSNDLTKKKIAESIQGASGMVILINPKNNRERCICIADAILNEATLSHCFGLYMAPAGKDVAMAVREEVADMYLFNELGKEGGRQYIRSMLDFQVTCNRWLGMNLDQMKKKINWFKEFLESVPEKFTNNRFFDYKKEIDCYFEREMYLKKWRDTPLLKEDEHEVHRRSRKSHPEARRRSPMEAKDGDRRSRCVDSTAKGRGKAAETTKGGWKPPKIKKTAKKKD